MNVNIVRLNDYPPDRYNVLVPVTTMQAASALQKITVSQVKLDTRKESNDIYYEKSSGKYAISKVGGMKLAAAANISIVSTEPGRTETCQRCIEMARATGKARSCGDCQHVHDVAVTVTIRVPEPSGGFRMMQATKEIDTTLERSSMTDAQYKRFLPHRTAIAESKAFMRAIRAALGLAAGYELRDLEKPFVVARIVPNLDAPEMKEAIANNYLQSMGMLFESPAQKSLPTSAPAPETVSAYEDETPGSFDPAEIGGYNQDPHPDYEAPPPQDHREELERYNPEIIRCADCGRAITGGMSRNGKSWSADDIAGYSKRVYKRILCPDCQEQARGDRRR